MDLRVIDAEIQRYRGERPLEGEYLRRLEFYRQIWGCLEPHERRACERAAALELPSRSSLDDCLAHATPFLAQFPQRLDRQGVIDAAADAARCMLGETRFPQALRDELARAVNVLPIVLSESGFALAGRNPREYLSVATQTYAQARIAGESLPLVAAALSAALRAQLGPLAERLLAACSPGVFSQAHPTACPVCGSWATLSAVDASDHASEGVRKLGCTLCGTQWHFEFNRCAHCGTREEKYLQYFNIPGDERHLVCACDKCGEYVRTVSLEGPHEPYSIDVEDVCMTRLDDALAAMAAQREHAQSDAPEASSES